MVCVLATIFAAVVWVSINRLILYGRDKPLSPTTLGYLIVSTVAVAMTTFIAAVLAVAATE